MLLKLAIVVSVTVSWASGQVCPAEPGWLLTSTGCYFSSIGSNSSVEALPYSLALSYCKSQGAQLTSVNNLKENSVVVNLCGDNERCYIGLYLSTVEDLTTSFWTDGSNSTYRNWNVTAPTGGGKCTVIGKYNGSGVFEDNECNSNRSFICKLFSTYADCQDALSSGVTNNGEYVIAINNTRLCYAWCDMTTAGGGWLVFQRRQDGSVNFFRNWTEYVNGFGHASGEHWLGLDYINQLTISKHYRLRVDMADFEGQTAYEEYDIFVVDGASTNYTMTSLGRASGTAGDAMKAPTSGCGASAQAAVDMAFSTFDADHDSHQNLNCAVLYKAGWWYGSCLSCNPNGLYLNGTTQLATSDFWCPWKGYYYALKKIELKIKPCYDTTTAASISYKAPTISSTVTEKTTLQPIMSSAVSIRTFLTAVLDHANVTPILTSDDVSITTNWMTKAPAEWTSKKSIRSTSSLSAEPGTVVSDWLKVYTDISLPLFLDNCIRSRGAIGCAQLCDIVDGCLVFQYGTEGRQCCPVANASNPIGQFDSQPGWDVWMKKDALTVHAAIKASLSGI